MVYIKKTTIYGLSKVLRETIRICNKAATGNKNSFLITFSKIPNFSIDTLKKLATLSEKVSSQSFDENNPENLKTLREFENLVNEQIKFLNFGKHELLHKKLGKISVAYSCLAEYEVELKREEFIKNLLRNRPSKREAIIQDCRKRWVNLEYSNKENPFLEEENLPKSIDAILQELDLQEHEKNPSLSLMDIKFEKFKEIGKKINLSEQQSIYVAGICCDYSRATIMSMTNKNNDSLGALRRDIKNKLGFEGGVSELHEHIKILMKKMENSEAQDAADIIYNGTLEEKIELVGQFIEDKKVADMVRSNPQLLETLKTLAETQRF